MVYYWDTTRDTKKHVKKLPQNDTKREPEMAPKLANSMEIRHFEPLFKNIFQKWTKSSLFEIILATFQKYLRIHAYGPQLPGPLFKNIFKKWQKTKKNVHFSKIFSKSGRHFSKIFSKSGNFRRQFALPDHFSKIFFPLLKNIFQKWAAA